MGGGACVIEHQRATNICQRLECSLMQPVPALDMARKRNGILYWNPDDTDLLLSPHRHAHILEYVSWNLAQRGGPPLLSVKPVIDHLASQPRHLSVDWIGLHDFIEFNVMFVLRPVLEGLHDVISSGLSAMRTNMKHVVWVIACKAGQVAGRCILTDEFFGYEVVRSKNLDDIIGFLAGKELR